MQSLVVEELTNVIALSDTNGLILVIKTSTDLRFVVH
jgi:hypothetical protein